jgi:hypothetical protein
MSILLSETDIAHLLADDDAYIETGEYDIDFMCKAQAIHSVKYLEEPCKIHHNYVVATRSVCLGCMKQVHKELGI